MTFYSLPFLNGQTEEDQNLCLHSFNVLDILHPIENTVIAFTSWFGNNSAIQAPQTVTRKIIKILDVNQNSKWVMNYKYFWFLVIKFFIWMLLSTEPLVERTSGPLMGKRQTALHLGQVTWEVGFRAIFCQWKEKVLLDWISIKIMLVNYFDTGDAVSVLTGNEFGLPVTFIVHLHTDTTGGKIFHFFFHCCSRVTCHGSSWFKTLIMNVNFKMQRIFYLLKLCFLIFLKFCNRLKYRAKNIVC